MSEGFRAQPSGFATKAIHVGQDPEQWNSMAVIPPITTSTTFKQDGPGEHRVSFFYVRFHHYFSSRLVKQKKKKHRKKTFLTYPSMDFSGFFGFILFLPFRKGRYWYCEN